MGMSTCLRDLVEYKSGAFETQGEREKIGKNFGDTSIEL